MHFPLILTAVHSIKEVGARPGDRLHVHPLETPEIVLARPLVMPPGRLYGWLLEQLMAESLIVAPGRLRQEVARELERAAGQVQPVSPAPAPSRGRRPRLMLLE